VRRDLSERTHRGYAMVDRSRQAAREVSHGLALAAGEPEHAWGCATPAGQCRG